MGTDSGSKRCRFFVGAFRPKGGKKKKNIQGSNGSVVRLSAFVPVSFLALPLMASLTQGPIAAQPTLQQTTVSSEAVCSLREEIKDVLNEGKKHQSKRSEERACVPLAQGTPKTEKAEKKTSFPWQENICTVLIGTPMEAMVPALIKQDRRVAAFLVGIGRKESSWGQRAPSLDGKDCYNYWGYKGEGSRGWASGYGCFGTPEEAVEKVGARIAFLMESGHRDTPAEMIVWKCGSSCAGHSPESVTKWIADVSIFYNQIASDNLSMR